MSFWDWLGNMGGDKKEPIPESEMIDVSQISPHDYETLKHLDPDRIKGNWPIEPLQEEYNFPLRSDTDVPEYDYQASIKAHSRMHNRLLNTIDGYDDQIKILQKIHDDKPTTRKERESVAPLLEKLGLDTDAVPPQELIDQLKEWNKRWYDEVYHSVVGRGMDLN